MLVDPEIDRSSSCKVPDRVNDELTSNYLRNPIIFPFLVPDSSNCPQKAIDTTTKLNCSQPNSDPNPTLHLHHQNHGPTTTTPTQDRIARTKNGRPLLILPDLPIRRLRPARDLHDPSTTSKRLRQRLPGCVTSPHDGGRYQRGGIRAQVPGDEQGGQRIPCPCHSGRDGKGRWDGVSCC